MKKSTPTAALEIVFETKHLERCELVSIEALALAQCSPDRLLKNGLSQEVLWGAYRQALEAWALPPASFDNPEDFLQGFRTYALRVDVDTIGAKPSSLGPLAILLASVHSRIDSAEMLCECLAYASSLLAALECQQIRADLITPFLAQMARLMSRFCLFDEAEQLLNDAIARLQKRTTDAVDSGYTGARYDLIDALYVVKADSFEAVPPLARKDRKRSAKLMCEFINGPLQDAVTALEERYERGGKSADTLEKLHLIQRHRRHTWTASYEKEDKDEPVQPRAKDWLEIATGYSQIGDHRNTANVLCAYVDEEWEFSLTYEGKKLPNVEKLRDAEGCLIQIVSAYESRFPTDYARDPDVRAWYWAIARARFLLDEESTKILEAIKDGARHLSHHLDVVDTDAKARLAQRRDDWIGLALLLSNASASFVDEIYELVYGEARPPLHVSKQQDVLRVHCTRAATYLLGPTAGAARIQAMPSHDLALSLAQLLRRGQQDLAEFEPGKEVPDSEAKWLQLLERLCSQAKVRQFKAKVSDCSAKHLLIEAFGNASQLPWNGLLLHADVNYKGVLVNKLPDRTSKLPSEKHDRSDPVRIISCASASDELYTAFRSAYQSNPWIELVPVTEKSDFAAELQRPASAIVLLAHGRRTAVQAVPEIKLGEDWYSLEEVFENACLNAPIPAVGFVCFGGGGVVTSMGEWEALPEYLLRAGARTAVTSLWPAWLTRRVRRCFRKMLRTLRDAEASNLRELAWLDAEAAQRFLYEVKKKTRDSRFWSGWSVHVHPQAIGE